MKSDIDDFGASAVVKAEPRPLVGESPAIKKVLAAIERIAPTQAPVLIVGESGTGKEIAARTIHRSSSRAGGPFELVDCSGLTDFDVDAELFGRDGDREGAFERAEQGTLFFDEIGNLPLALQPRLLRALGEQVVCRGDGAPPRRIDVRIIASTSRDLYGDVTSGRFRADLYYRLAVIQIRMPPLRERQEDIPALVRALLPQIARERDLDVDTEPNDQVIESLSKHSWPGNVRELRNCLEQLVILRAIPKIEGDGAGNDGEASHPALARTDSTSPSHNCTLAAFEELHRLPFRIAKAMLIERFERDYIARLLHATGGNVAEAARRAGIDRVTLFRAIHRLNHQKRETATDKQGAAE